MRMKSQFKIGDLVVNTKLGVLALISSIDEFSVNVIYLDRDETSEFNSIYSVEVFNRVWRIMG